MSAARLIAVDGPAASGKGTISKRLAQTLDYAYLDTGLLYRATAAAVLRHGADPHDEAACAHLAHSLELAHMAQDDLRAEHVGRMASIVAAHPAVRTALLSYQRQFAALPPDDKAGAVLDGRDIGTVVCPDAPIKLFITASAHVRAQRRFQEIARAGAEITFEAVLADIKARDARDVDRATAPLVQAADAILIDTSDLDIEAAFKAAVRAVEPCI